MGPAVVAEASDSKFFFMGNSASNKNLIVGGYWEYEGYWQDSLILVLDQISQACGLNRSFVMMNAERGSGLNQKVMSDLNESTALSVDWDQVQMSPFDPESPQTILNILNSVKYTYILLDGLQI